MRLTALPFAAAVLLAPFVRVTQETPSPEPDHGPAAQQALADEVDRLLDAARGAQGLEASPAADDETWLRRLSVDLCGTIPSRDEVDAFLAEPRAERRTRAIDRLLLDRRFAQNLSSLWTNLLLAEAGKDGDRTRPWLRTWLEGEIARGARFHEITRRLIADQETAKTPGATAFVLTYRDALETLTGITARAFLGLQIQCSQCHDDPAGKWTQKDFSGFTGFFADMHVDHVKDRDGEGGRFRVTDHEPARGAGGAPAGRKGTMSGGEPDGDPAAPEDAEITPEELRELLAMKFPEERRIRVDELLSDPKKLERILASPGAREMVAKIRRRRAQFGAPSFPGGAPYVAVPGESKREALASWVVGPGNPWFARAIVNRLWAHLFGKGLVEPVDDLSGSDDQVCPELLDRLAAEFSAHDTDLRFLAGALVRTRAYALSNPLSADAQAAARQERWFAARPMRPFTAEQMADSLLRLHGRDEAPGSLTARQERASGRAELIAALRRSFGELNGNGRGGTAPGIPQALFLMNGAFARLPPLLATEAVLAPLADEARPPVERLQPLFRAVISRSPAPDEAEALLVPLGDARADPEGAAGRLYWALLNSTEFRTHR